MAMRLDPPVHCLALHCGQGTLLVGGVGWPVRRIWRADRRRALLSRGGLGCAHARAYAHAHARSLQELGRLTGWPIIANSSFNRKGQAMINTLDASFRLLDGTPELSGLVVEEWWFEQRHRI